MVVMCAATSGVAFLLSARCAPDSVVIQANPTLKKWFKVCALNAAAVAGFFSQTLREKRSQLYLERLM
jgi:hypothetical protein